MVEAMKLGLYTIIYIYMKAITWEELRCESNKFLVIAIAAPHCLDNRILVTSVN